MFALQLCRSVGAASLAELFDRITADDWLLWMAAWSLDPWGDQRADARNAAAISYLLSPWLPKDHELPNLTHPYFADEDQPTPAEITAALADHRRRWDAWEAEHCRHPSTIV